VRFTGCTAGINQARVLGQIACLAVELPHYDLRVEGGRYEQLLAPHLDPQQGTDSVSVLIKGLQLFRRGIIGDVPQRYVTIRGTTRHDGLAGGCLWSLGVQREGDVTARQGGCSIQDRNGRHRRMIVACAQNARSIGLRTDILHCDATVKLATCKSAFSTVQSQ